MLLQLLAPMEEWHIYTLLVVWVEGLLGLILLNWPQLLIESISLNLSQYRLLSLYRLPLMAVKLLAISPGTLAISLALIWYVVLTMASILLMLHLWHLLSKKIEDFVSFDILPLHTNGMY